MSRIKGRAWRRKTYVSLVERDGERCAICGIGARIVWRPVGVYVGEHWGDEPWQRSQYTSVNPSSSLEIEHLLALRDGGNNDLANLRLICIPCHKVKSAAERRARSRSA